MCVANGACWMLSKVIFIYKCLLIVHCMKLISIIISIFKICNAFLGSTE